MLRPAAIRIAGRAVARRYTTSAGESVREAASHAGKKSSDMPWAIGSALTFIPALVYLTSPQDTKDKVKHAVPHPANKNFGISRMWKEEPEDEAAPAAVEEDEVAPIPGSDEAAGQESSRSVEVDQRTDRPWQGSETFKTPRDSHPGVDNALEDMQGDRDADHVTRQKNPTEKGPATLQPDAGKLNHAAELARQGDHHDPKAGQAKREQEKKETGMQPKSEDAIMKAEKTEAEADPYEKGVVGEKGEAHKKADNES